MIQNDDGAVVGVRATGPRNKPLEYRGKAVILGCGGFEGNAEMMSRYLGPRSLYLRSMSKGCHYNKGEGIAMALAIGAAPCGDFGSFHASPMDPRSDRAGPSIYIYPQGILVNQNGQRFVDEGPGSTDETYENVTREINAQPGGIAYAVLDTTLAKVAHPESVVRSEVPPYQADTLAGLAAQLKIDADALAATVAAYNKACGTGTYNEADMDGLCTRGISPRKSNWARPIAKPPYIAYPIISSIVLTFGGLKVTPEARVVNQQGDVIPGLYAAGETLGLYYRSYTGATSVLKGLVFGRIAGMDAAKALLT